MDFPLRVRPRWSVSFLRFLIRSIARRLHLTPEITPAGKTAAAFLHALEVKHVNVGLAFRIQ